MKQASKVDVAAVHHIECPWLQDQYMHQIDLEHIAIADVNEDRNRAPEVQQCVQLDGYLDFGKRRLLKQAKAQIDGSGVLGVNRILEIESQVLVQIELESALKQNCSQVGPNSPVARLVGKGQGEKVNAVAKSHGVQLARVGSKSHFDVSQTRSPSQLGKSHGSKLLRVSQTAHTLIATLARHDSVKACLCNELHDLSTQGLAVIHRKPPSSLSLGNYTAMVKRVSNRYHIKLASRPRQYWHSI